MGCHLAWVSKLLRGWGSLGGSEKNRGTVITSLQLVFRSCDRNFMPFSIHKLRNSAGDASSKTQGQIVGTRESLNGRKNRYGTEKSKQRREEPLGTMSYQTSSKRSLPFWLLIGARKLVFFWHQSEDRTAATVWNWSRKTLYPGALLTVLYFSSFHIYFSARLDFPSSPLSAPGSPRMLVMKNMPGTFSIYFTCLQKSPFETVILYSFWAIPPNKIGKHAQVKRFPNRSTKHASFTTD